MTSRQLAERRLRPGREAEQMWAALCSRGWRQRDVGRFFDDDVCVVLKRGNDMTMIRFRILSLDRKNGNVI